MSLIQCYGKVSLPRSYRRFMRLHVADFRSRREKYLEADTFTQDRMYDPAEKASIYNTTEVKLYDLGETHGRPAICRQLVGSLASIQGGHQFHTVMTCAAVETHSDHFPEERPLVLIIPYQASEHHYLQVEGHEMQILPGHVYAFDQRKEHSLLYKSKRGLIMNSMPCSMLNVSFSVEEGDHRWL